MTTLFDQLGPTALRALITDFYRRIFDDIMIGFLFTGKDRARLIEREYEMVARMLGGNIRYQGRPLREAHARVPILGGHFDRRLQIMRDALAHADAPAAVRDAIIGHTIALRAQVTADPTSDCNHTQTASRTVIAPIAPDAPVRLGRRGAGSGAGTGSGTGTGSGSGTDSGSGTGTGSGSGSDSGTGTDSGTGSASVTPPAPSLDLIVPLRRR